MEGTYEDKSGYLRFKNNDKLVHRKVAYEEIYEGSEWDHIFPFSEMVVHHIDGNKKNNDTSNLRIMTQGEHEIVHGIDNTKRTKEYSGQIEFDLDFIDWIMDNIIIIIILFL